MLNLFRSGDQSPPLIPKPDPGPDYAALVESSSIFSPDSSGEIVLDAQEASRIRKAGWSARRGVWRAPFTPWRFKGRLTSPEQDFSPGAEFFGGLLLWDCGF